MWKPVAPYLYLASAFSDECGMPVFHGSRIPDLASTARAVEGGHVDMFGHDPRAHGRPAPGEDAHRGRLEDIRQCVGASYCNDRSSTGRDVVCIQNEATGCEATLPRLAPKAAGGRRRVFVMTLAPAVSMPASGCGLARP